MKVNVSALLFATIAGSACAAPAEASRSQGQGKAIRADVSLDTATDLDDLDSVAELADQSAQSLVHILTRLNADQVKDGAVVPSAVYNPDVASKGEANIRKLPDIAQGKIESGPRRRDMQGAQAETHCAGELCSSAELAALDGFSLKKVLRPLINLFQKLLGGKKKSSEGSGGNLLTNTLGPITGKGKDKDDGNKKMDSEKIDDKMDGEKMDGDGKMNGSDGSSSKTPDATSSSMMKSSPSEGPMDGMRKRARRNLRA